MSHNKTTLTRQTPSTKYERIACFLHLTVFLILLSPNILRGQQREEGGSKPDTLRQASVLYEALLPCLDREGKEVLLSAFLDQERLPIVLQERDACFLREKELGKEFTKAKRKGRLRAGVIGFASGVTLAFVLVGIIAL